MRALSRRILVSLVSLAAMAGLRTAIQAQVPLGDEFSVSDSTLHNQTDPFVVRTNDESYLLMWHESALGEPVRGRSLGPAGQTGPERGLAGATGVHGSARGDMNAAGVLWIASDAPGGPYVQQLTPAGIRLGAPIQVDSSIGGGQASVFVRADGTFVVCWHGTDVQGGEDPLQQIYFRVFSRTGEPLGGPRAVAPQTDRQQYEPRVAGADDGSFLIAWTQDEPPEHRGGLDVFLRRFAADGSPRALPERLSVVADHAQYLGGLDCTPAGWCVAVFSSDSAEPDVQDVFYRLWDESGSALTGDVRVNEHGPSNQFQSSVSMNRAGEFAVSWVSEFQNGTYFDVYARTYRASGRPSSREIHVNSLPPDRGEENPQIALADEGSLVVTWEAFSPEGDQGSNVFARRFLRGCEAGSGQLALGSGRFEVCARFESTVRSGAAVPWELQEHTGAFWFFDDEVLELAVKVIDGCDLNGAIWLFAAGLTDVGVDLTLRDTWTGRTRTYWSPAGAPFNPLLDTQAMPACSSPISVLLAGARATHPGAVPTPYLSSPRSRLAEADSGDCAVGGVSLCLHESRFRASATFRAFDGRSGNAMPVSLNDDGGFFWFFALDTYELLLKVVDGCSANGHFWVYASGLTNVEVSLVLEDTASGRAWSASTDLGESFVPNFDVLAFPCDP